MPTYLKRYHVDQLDQPRIQIILNITIHSLRNLGENSVHIPELLLEQTLHTKLNHHYYLHNTRPVDKMKNAALYLSAVLMYTDCKRLSHPSLLFNIFLYTLFQNQYRTVVEMSTTRARSFFHHLIHLIPDLRAVF